MEGGMRERKASLCRVEEGDEPAKAGGTAQTSRASGFLATEACTPRGVATHLGKHWLNEPTAITHKAGNSNSGNDLSLGARCGQDLSLQQPVVKVPASHRGRRGAPMGRGDDREYRAIFEGGATQANGRGPRRAFSSAVGWSGDASPAECSRT